MIGVARAAVAAAVLVATTAPAAAHGPHTLPPVPKRRGPTAGGDGLPPGDLPALHGALWTSAAAAIGLFSPLGSYGLEAELGHRRWSLSLGVGHGIGEVADRELLELAAMLRGRAYLDRAIALGGGLGLSRSLGARDVFDDALDRPTWLNGEAFVERAYGAFVMRGALGGGVVAASRGCSSDGAACDRRGQLAPYGLLTIGYVF